MAPSAIINIEQLGFQWKAKDPFLFCVHHNDHFPKGKANLGPAPETLMGRNIGQDFVVKDGWRMYHGQRVPGFPSHPHRGFETVTVVRKGFVDHTDSLKAAGRYGNGDVQWMTAGKGLQHAEMFPLLNQDTDNPLELFQIWLNLPAKSKFVEPYFRMHWSEEIPKHTISDQEGKQSLIEVISGEFDGHMAQTPPPDSWAATKENEVAIWNIKMDEGASVTLPKASAGINRTLYFYEGDVLLIDNDIVPEYHLAEVAANAEITLKASKSNCSILVLQGKPIAEPVVQYGPFVMNTRAEIQEAYEDFQKTQFGGWPWPTYEPVHGDKKRFAQHADGKIEIKEK